ncbi:MAG: DUF1501 domain-containing protein, partial [Planctomycetia bacterium]|nr:DUF1501 domain-containing protein [Planctomycetia bacterium]
MQTGVTTAASMKRREFLRVGLAGLGSLSLPGLLRLRAEAAGSRDGERTALILVWLRGGASHLETYDPKPAATSEFRGPHGSIETRVPGLRLGELLPRHAAMADRFTILRSMAHTGGGHPAGSLQLLTGDPASQDKPKPEFPDLFTVANYLRFDPARTIPNYVGVNGISTYDGFVIAGPAYLGARYEPFRVSGDPSAPEFHVPNIGLDSAGDAGRMRDRIGLRQSFDRIRRQVDSSGTMRAIDSFEAQALNLEPIQILYAWPLAREVRFEGAFLPNSHGGVPMADGCPSKFHQIPEAL